MGKPFELVHAQGIGEVPLLTVTLSGDFESVSRRAAAEMLVDMLAKAPVKNEIAANMIVRCTWEVVVPFDETAAEEGRDAYDT